MMDKLSELEFFILDSLTDDDERFECIYAHVNDSNYINHSCNPLYTSLFQFPVPKKYNPKEVFYYTKKLIQEGFIDCLIVARDEKGNYSPQKVNSPNFEDFSIFATYWLRLTKKGREEVNKDIYKDYYDKFQRDNKKKN